VSSAEQGGRVQIVRVSKESPAQKAGLAPGDLVLAVDGARVATLEEFYKKLWARARPDADVSLTVYCRARTSRPSCSSRSTG
jgi:serine protease Do